MDEPSAPSTRSRARLQDEFLRLQESVRKTVLFVTHDIDEAVRVGDRIAILREGVRAARHAERGAGPPGRRIRRASRRRRPGLKLLSLHRVEVQPSRSSSRRTTTRAWKARRRCARRR